ncbi:MAG: NUDIX hydrolase [Candidatus Schekmanbacteria bacterium]|nr:NUDIX hydrolase [Candidatus Schekmanbacteria bacterium]
MRTRPDYFYTQSAVIPFRGDSRERLEVLMITSRKRRRWIVPKGIVERDLSGLESAVNEALEEAGVEGEGFTRVIGSYEYSKWGDVCSVTVYALRVVKEHADWPEATFRERRWFALEEAATAIGEAGLRDIIRHLPALVSGHSSEAMSPPDSSSTARSKS